MSFSLQYMNYPENFVDPHKEVTENDYCPHSLVCAGLIRWLHPPAAKVLKKRRRINNFIERAGYTGPILAKPLALKYFNLLFST